MLICRLVLYYLIIFFLVLIILYYYLSIRTTSFTTPRRVSNYVANSQTLNTIRKLNQLGVPSLIENLVTGKSAGQYFSFINGRELINCIYVYKIFFSSPVDNLICRFVENCRVKLKRGKKFLNGFDQIIFRHLYLHMMAQRERN